MPSQKRDTENPNRRGGYRAEWIVGLRQFILDVIGGITGSGGGGTGGGGLADSGVTPGIYTGRKYDFAIDAKGRVVDATPTQCSTWNYEGGGTLALPATGSTTTVPFDTAVICNPAMDITTYGKLTPPVAGTAFMEYYATIPLPGGWAAAEVIADLYHHNDGGPSEDFVCELGRGYADATPKPPTLVISGSVHLLLEAVEDDFYYIRLRQTGAGVQIPSSMYWRWSGQFIDAGDCDACEG